jgi:hypothetical protein
MAVEWGLAAPRFNALETLQAFGAAQQQRMQQQALEMKQAEQQRALQTQAIVGQRAQAGDYQGAQQVAAASGDFDLATQIQRLGAGERDRLKAEGEAIGRAAFALRRLPQDQRAQAIQAMAPALRQAGLSDQEIAGADLSDGGLDGYVALATSINDQFGQSQPRYQVIPEGGTLVDTRNPDAVRSVAGGGAPSGGGSLEAQAQAAIAAGADPAAVRARLQQMQGGAAPQANSPFPIQ